MTLPPSHHADPSPGRRLLRTGLWPVFAEGELPDTRLPALAPDALDVAVANGGQITLAPRRLCDITAGTGAEITFTGGSCGIGSIIGGDNVSLLFAGPTRLGIHGRLGLGNNAFLGPGPGSTATASSIELTVAGSTSKPTTRDQSRRPPSSATTPH